MAAMTSPDVLADTSVLRVAVAHPTNFRYYVATATAVDSRCDLGEVPGTFQQRRRFMAQHFLLSAAARSLSPAKVMGMSEVEAENVFARLRWPQTDGNIIPRISAEKVGAAV